MAKSRFEVSAPEKRTVAEVKKTALSKDAQQGQYTIPASTDEVLTLNGGFYESTWTRGEGSNVTSGTILYAGATKADNTEIKVPFGFFRTKKRIEEDGVKSFKACFSDDDTFTNMVDGITNGKKIQVKRGEWLRPGWTSPVSITTVIWAE